MARDPIRLQLVLLRVYAFFTYPFACVPFLYFYFADQGIDLDSGYGLLISVYYVTMFVAEVPTGYLADRFGRKLPCILGPALLAIGFVEFAAGSTLFEFCVGEVLMGLGHAFLSGPPAALLFETLKRAGRSDEFLREESRMHAIRLAGTGAAFLIGGEVAHGAGLEACIWVTAPLCFIAGLTAFGLLDVDRVRTSTRRPPILAAAARDLRIPAVAWLMIYFVILFCLLRYPFHLYQAYLRNIGMENYRTIGWLFFALNLVAAPCSRLAPTFEQRFGERGLFLALPLSLSISLCLLSVFPSAWAVSLFFVQQIPFGMHWAVVQNFVNHRLSGTARATALSTLSLAARLTFAGAFWLTTELARDVGEIYWVVGVIGVIATIAWVWVGRRHLAT